LGGLRYIFSLLSDPQNLSMKMLSSARPLPSMDIWTSFALSAPTNTQDVNCDPWSVLNISGLPCLLMVSRMTSRHHSELIVLETSQPMILRLYTSIMANMYIKPRNIGM